MRPPTFKSEASPWIILLEQGVFFACATVEKTTHGHADMLQAALPSKISSFALFFLLTRICHAPGRVTVNRDYHKQDDPRGRTIGII